MKTRLLALTTTLGLGAFLPLHASAQQWDFGGVGIPIVCAFNTSPPTVASGKFVYAQCNNAGTLLGTGGGGGGGGTSSNFGAAFPSAGTAAGFKDSTGTNMAAGNLDASGNLNVDVQAGSVTFSWPGTAGNATGGTTTAGTMPYVNAFIRATSGSIPSGAFASGSISAGAIASGAVASGAFSSGSFVSGALADGAITTIGTEADTAWTGGGNPSTVVQALKKIANNTTSLGPVTLASGAVASGAYSSGAFASGSISSGAVASGAYASGSFVAGALTDGAISTMGLKADSAWTTGPGSEISILKTIAGNTGNPAPVPGWLTGAIDTPIAVTTAGNSTTISSAANEVLAENVGTSNPAYCGIGGSSTSSYKQLQPNGGWFVWQVNGATQLTCLTVGSGLTTTVNVQTGSGSASGTANGGYPGTAGVSSYGTAPSGTVPGVNAFITNGQALVNSNQTLAAPGASPNVPILQQNGGLSYMAGAKTSNPLLALTNSGVTVDGQAGQLFMADCYNPNASAVGYLQIYDALTVTGQPVYVIGVPAASHAGYTMSGIGMQFNTGITMQAATTPTGSTALGSAMVCNAAFN